MLGPRMISHVELFARYNIGRIHVQEYWALAAIQRSKEFDSALLSDVDLGRESLQILDALNQVSFVESGVD